MAAFLLTLTVSTLFPLPYQEYEAEEGIGGVVLGPGFTLGTPESEASGRRFVKLTEAGETLSFRVREPADTLVVRYSIPDSVSGGGQSCMLEILVNGKPAGTIGLDSRCAWVYGRYPWSNNPADGSPRRFFDESHTRIPPVKTGDTLTIRKPDGIPFAVSIDLLDLEWAGDPLPQPVNSLSLADYKPAADGVNDDTSRMNRCIADAKRRDLEVWVPPGTYRIGCLDVSGVTIRGAGMWHTRFTGPLSRFHCTGGNLGFYDFAVIGETDSRDDRSPDDNAFSGNPGRGTVMERIWVERKKCAFWVGEWKNPQPASGLVIRNCRFRNLMADAVNFCNGTSDSLVADCLIRNAGDDALACWSPADGGPQARGNVFSGNLVQNTWLANGLALYGGRDMTVTGNVVIDTVTTGSGIYLAAHFGAHPFGGTISVSDNTLVRCGSAESDPGGPAGALRILAWDHGITGADIRVSDIRIIDPVVQGISLQTRDRYRITGVHIRRITFSGLMECGVDIRPGARGEAFFEDLTATEGREVGIRDGFGGLFALKGETYP
jgi:hypothetical protein